MEHLIFFILSAAVVYITFRNIRHGLYLVALSLPLQLFEIPLYVIPGIMMSGYGGPERAVVTVNITDIALLALCLKSLCVMRVKRVYAAVKSPVGVALLSVLAAFILSIVAAGYRGILSGIYLRTSILYFMKFTEAALIFFLFASWIENTDDVKGVINVILAIGAASAFLGFAGVNIFNTRLIIGGFFSILAAYCFCAAVRKDAAPAIRFMFVALFVSFVVPILICQKRSAYLCLLATMSALFFIRREKKAALLLITFILALMMLLKPARESIARTWDFYAVTAKDRASQQPDITREEFEAIIRDTTKVNLEEVLKGMDIDRREKVKRFIDSIAGLPGGKESSLIVKDLDPSIITRVYQATSAINDFTSYPATGVGFWGSLGRRYASHNAYIQLLAETGLVGFLAFCGLLLAMSSRSLAVYRQSSDSIISDFSCSFFAGLAGIMTMGLFSEVFVVFTLTQAVFLMAGLVASGDVS